MQSAYAMSWGFLLMPVALLFALLVALLGFGLLAFVAIRAVSGRKGSAYSAEEARTMQELHTGLSKLSDRVEALETLLLAEQSGKEARAARTRSTF